MSALPRPSAFRPFTSSSSKNGVLQPKTSNDFSILYDNCKLSQSRTNGLNPPSPPPRKCNELNCKKAKDSIETCSIVSSTASDKPSAGSYYNSYYNRTSQGLNSSAKSERNNNDTAGPQSGFYNSFMNNNNNNNTSFVSSKNKCSNAIPTQDSHNGLLKMHETFGTTKTIGNQNRFPNGNFSNYTLPSCTADSGVSVQNYSTTCSFSSRNSSGMSDSGVVELEVSLCCC